MKPRNLVIIVIGFVLVLFIGVYLGKSSNQPNLSANKEPVATNSNVSQVPQSTEKPQLSLEEALSTDLLEAEKQAAAEMVVECYETYHSMSDIKLEDYQKMMSEYTDKESRELMEIIDGPDGLITYLHGRDYQAKNFKGVGHSFNEARSNETIKIYINNWHLAAFLDRSTSPGKQIKWVLETVHPVGFEKYAVVTISYDVIIKKTGQKKDFGAYNPYTEPVLCGFKNDNWYIIPIR